MWALGGFIAVRFAFALRRERFSRLTRPGLLVIAGILIGGGLMAAQLLPGLELQSLGPRRAGGLTIDQALILAPTPKMMLPQMVDSAAGSPRWLYVGILPLLLSPVALFASRRTPALYFFALALLSLGVVLSVDTPAFNVYRILRGGSWFRAPPRILYLYAVAAAVLSAIGLHPRTSALRSDLHEYVG